MGVVGGVFLGAFVAIGLGLLAFGLNALRLSQAAAAWPTTPGLVTSSRFEVDSDSDGTTYKVKLTYAYNVNGRDYEGERIAFGYAGSSSEKFHRDIHRAIRQGVQVAVRYDPNNPSRAVLSHGVNQSIIFVLMFGLVWTLFTGGMFAMAALGARGADRLLGTVVIY